MESIEDKLKELILSRYKSIRQFSFDINMPYSTIDTIFKRGLANASISNVIKICSALGISTDMLANGEIKSAAEVKPTFSLEEKQFIIKLRTLNAEGKEKVFVYTEDLIASEKYSTNKLK